MAFFLVIFLIVVITTYYGYYDSPTPARKLIADIIWVVGALVIGISGALAIMQWWRG